MAALSGRMGSSSKTTTLEALQAVLDELYECAATARVAGARDLMVEAMSQRSATKSEVNRLLMGENVEVDIARTAATKLREATAALASKKGIKWRSVQEARLRQKTRDIECAEGLGRLREALDDLDKTERSPAFRRALLMDTMRLAGENTPDALAFGTTPVSSMRDILAPVFAKNGTNRNTFVVLGSSTGRFCFYAAAAFQLRVIGIDVAPTVVAVAQRVARKFPELGVSESDFICGDARHVAAPLLAGADVVLITSLCWDHALRENIAALLELNLPTGALVVDYAPSAALANRPACFRRFFSHDVRVPVSWSPLEGQSQALSYFQKIA